MISKKINKKLVFGLLIIFGLITISLGLIYGIGIFGEPKNPLGINSEQECRDNGGKVLEGDKNLCQLPGNDSFKIDR